MPACSSAYSRNRCTLFRRRSREYLQRAIHTCFDRIYHDVTDDQVEPDIRIAGLEFTQQRSEMPEHQPGQRLHAQRTGRLCAHVAHLVDNVVGPYDQIGAIVQESLPQLAQANDSRAAVEQRHTQVILKLFDSGCDYRFGNPHLTRGLGKTLRLRHAYKCLDVLKTIHQGTVPARFWRAR